MEVSEEAKEPERGDRHRHGQDCPRDGLKRGVRLQLPACPGDQHHQGRERQKHRAGKQATDCYRTGCRVDVQADLVLRHLRDQRSQRERDDDRHQRGYKRTRSGKQEQPGQHAT